MSNEKQREPEVNSRSQQKRIAAMKGGPAPTFEAAAEPAQPVPPRAHDDTVDLLQNLLAVIHRDGGHYVTEHGIEKAAEDAEKIVVSMRASRNEILQEALDACEQFDRTVEVRKCMDKIRALQVAAPAVAPQKKRLF
jgi:hypothetical protein